jgi:hypothetical protein
MCSTLAPSHLLFLHHPFAHDLIDCRLSRRKPTVLNLMPPGISRSPPTCSDPCWWGSGWLLALLKYPPWETTGLSSPRSPPDGVRSRKRVLGSNGAENRFKRCDN